MERLISKITPRLLTMPAYGMLVSPDVIGAG